MIFRLQFRELFPGERAFKTDCDKISGLNASFFVPILQNREHLAHLLHVRLQLISGNGRRLLFKFQARIANRLYLRFNLNRGREGEILSLLYPLLFYPGLTYRGDVILLDCFPVMTINKVGNSLALSILAVEFFQYIPGNFTWSESFDPRCFSSLLISHVQFMLHIIPGNLKRNSFFYGTDILDLWFNKFTHSITLLNGYVNTGSSLVRERGFEPLPAQAGWILSPVRLPIPPPSHFRIVFIFIRSFYVNQW